MEPIYDPVRLRQPKLREFAFQAAWIATVAETVNDLEDLLGDLPPKRATPPGLHHALALGLRLHGGGPDVGPGVSRCGRVGAA
jgi:hypothetical protein